MCLEKSGKPAKANALTKAAKYAQSCRTEFWQDVFRVECEYLIQHLQGCKTILSVGCGPASIETRLAEQGFKIVGLDVSQEALHCPPDKMRTVVGRAEALPFLAAAFDAVIFIVSLQFMENVHQAIEEAARVVRPKGKVIAMLLNPESDYFKIKVRNRSSYISGIKQSRLDIFEHTLGKRFKVRSEYFMGIKDEEIFESQNPNDAALYIIQGNRI